MAAIPVESQPARLAYSPAEFAEAIGCSRQHVANLIARGQIHSVKVGRARRIPTSEMERVLAEGTR